MIPSNNEIQFKEYVRLIAVTASGAMSEVVCYIDTGHIYAGIMTGNTVQLGWLLWAGEWTKVIPLLWVIVCFVIGCIAGQIIICKHMPLTFIYGFMLILLVSASFFRIQPSFRLLFELPTLAFAVAIQAVSFPKFDGIGLQTVVTTNNIVKFITGLVNRYLYPPSDSAKKISAAEVWIPGVCWLTFIISAGIGGLLVTYTNKPLGGSIFIITVFLCLNLYLLLCQKLRQYRK